MSEDFLTSFSSLIKIATKITLSNSSGVSFDENVKSNKQTIFTLSKKFNETLFDMNFPFPFSISLSLTVDSFQLFLLAAFGTFDGLTNQKIKRKNV